MRLSFAVLFALLPAIIATPIKDTGIAPLSSNGKTIEDSYIVVFKKDVNIDQIALHLDGVTTWNLANPLVSANGDVEGLNHVYAPATPNFSYKGYSGRFSKETLEKIRSAPEVAYVEHDQIVHTQDEVHGVDELIGDAMTTQRGAPWGLARVSHREPLRLGTFNQYTYDSNGGDGVTAYVIDTGINIDHVEFEGRAKWGKTIPRNDRDIDGNGHGTHCAGTIASAKYGVAKKAEVVAVKVLGTNGSGTMSDVVAGVVWAAENASAKAAAAARELALTGKTKHKGSVANMSLGGGSAPALDQAVDAAVEAGLYFAVAAGNDNADACKYSPAASQEAITVGASTLGDQRAYFSNHGKCVDVFAPGLNILSTWTGSKEATNTISGTSMASPHICGLLAYLLSIEGTESFPFSSEELVEAIQEPSLYAQAYPLLPEIMRKVLPAPEVSPTALERVGGGSNPRRLKKALIALASPGMLSDLPAGTPNLLAFNNATAHK